MSPTLDKILDFQIDAYLNPYIPPPRLSHLPKPLSRFLGYRTAEYKEPPSLILCLWSFIGALAGLITVGALFNYAPGLSKYNPPVLIASLVSSSPTQTHKQLLIAVPQGASAILDYNCIRAPLAQPRNAFFGQLLSALLGVGITKLFRLSPAFAELQWVAGVVCCASASLLMALTNTTYPPGGATAVLAATNAQVMGLGWMFVPFVMLASVVMLGIGLVVNNIQRQYPVYWWTPVDLKELHQSDLEKVETGASKEVLRGRSIAKEEEVVDRVVIAPGYIGLPQGMELDADEMAVVARLQARLRWDFEFLERGQSLGGRTVTEGGCETQ